MKERAEFNLLVREYLKPIYGFAYKYAKNREDAEDIAQEVFVKVWKNFKKIDRTKNPKPWIFAIAKNAAIDFLRKKKTMPFNDESAILEMLADPAPLARTLLETTELTETLASAIGNLPAKYQQVVSLRFNENYTFREIAESLEEPLNTVKSKYRRALLALKKILNAPNW